MLYILPNRPSLPHMLAHSANPPPQTTGSDVHKEASLSMIPYKRSSPPPHNRQWSGEDGVKHLIPIKAEIVGQTAGPLMWGGGQGLTRTLPVSVWADIITPAQSFTEVIQPTSAATVSSFSSTGLRVPSAWLEPLLIFWASWQEREQGLRCGHQEDLKNIFYPKELKPDGPLLRWTWFEGTEVRKKGWIMALIVLLNLFLKRTFPLFPLKLFLWKKEWNYSLSILKKKKSKSSGEKPSCLGWEWPGRKWSRHSVISTCPAFIPFLQLHSIFRRKSPPSHSVCMVQKGLKVYTVSRSGGWSIRPVYPFGNSSWAKDGYMNYANPIQLKPAILLKRVRKVTLLWEWS